MNMNMFKPFKARVDRQTRLLTGAGNSGGHVPTPNSTTSKFASMDRSELREMLETNKVLEQNQDSNDAILAARFMLAADHRCNRYRLNY